MENKDYIPPTLEKRFNVLLEQVELMCKYKEPRRAVLEARN